MPILVNLVAVVAGGVIVNTSIAELPKEREGRRWSFLAGAMVYTALLLILSHFEKGGMICGARHGSEEICMQIKTSRRPGLKYEKAHHRRSGDGNNK